MASESGDAARDEPPKNDNSGQGEQDRQDNFRKRKRDDRGKLKHGSRGKRKNLGRKEYFENQLDRRERNEVEKAKRRRTEEGGGETATPNGPPAFSKEEIEAEEKRPKRKVAVMIGYSGSGYKGMQITPSEKTIEGDLFTAFVLAGAISKANADDPKKSSLVRCARTDKGVHAAGNVISLKLIVEDPDIVERINAHLGPQIRVWGIERALGSFSCYQACDSRWYEYLIPSYAFLPPHPNSFLGKQLREVAEKEGDLQGYEERQKEVRGWWESKEEEFVKPALEKLDPEIRLLVERALFREEITGEGADSSSGSDVADEKLQAPYNDPADVSKELPPGDALAQLSIDTRKELTAGIRTIKAAYIEAARTYQIDDARLARVREALGKYVGTQNYHNYTVGKNGKDPSVKRHIKSFEVDIATVFDDKKREGTGPVKQDGVGSMEENSVSVETTKEKSKESTPAAGKKGVMDQPSEVEVWEAQSEATRVEPETADQTVQPAPVTPAPRVDDKTQYLSLRVHGQSFMMHQIRKMVGMASLVVRCGCPPERIKESLRYDTAISIPKAPGLGLLLERPVFDSYNAKAEEHGRAPIAFDKYEKELVEFKRKEIYGRMRAEEVADNVFYNFYAHVDSYREPIFLYLTSAGIPAAKSRITADPGSKAAIKDRDFKQRNWGKKKAPSKKWQEAPVTGSRTEATTETAGAQEETISDTRVVGGIAGVDSDEETVAVSEEEG
ncbi:pseudouridine synthase [Lineolata rhizophorae]|uniref:tRNA pseudouridine synthase 1 n=1 Tax=Lineolata rhizophorae TaxID=578093 RepID=A0A6A6NXR6_9PEZI|nr:pseudouridine synthase [Lineolata rhizophorae]